MTLLACSASSSLADIIPRIVARSCVRVTRLLAVVVWTSTDLPASTTLAFGVQGIESERRLARSGKTRYDDEAIAWQVDIDVLEIVRARAAYAYEPARARVRSGSAVLGTRRRKLKNG